MYIVDGLKRDEIAEESDRSHVTVANHITRFLSEHLEEEIESLRQVQHRRDEIATELGDVLTGDADEPAPEPQDPGTPDDVDETPETATPEPEPEPAQREQPADPRGTPTGQGKPGDKPRSSAMAPPRPDQYFEPAESQDDDTITPMDVFRHVVDDFPDYGDNVTDDKAKQFLVERAEWNGVAPRPEEFYAWLSSIPGLGESVAGALRQYYSEALNHQVQRGNIKRHEISEMYAPSNQQQPEPQQEQVAATSEHERQLSRVAVAGGRETAEQPQNGYQGPSDAEQHLMEYAVDGQPATNGGAAGTRPQPPGSPQGGRAPGGSGGQRGAAQSRQASGRQQGYQQQQRQQTPQTAAGAAPAHPDSLESRLEVIEKRIEQAAQDDSPTSDITQVVDQLVTVEENLDRLRGQEGGDDPRIDRIEQRIAELYSTMQEGGGGSPGGESDILGTIAQADMNPGEKAEIMTTLEQASADPEIRREEFKLERHKEWADTVSEVFDRLVSGVSEGGSSPMFHIGQLLNGMRQSGQQQGQGTRQQGQYPQGQYGQQPQQPPRGQQPRQPQQQPHQPQQPRQPAEPEPVEYPEEREASPAQEMIEGRQERPPETHPEEPGAQEPAADHPRDRTEPAPDPSPADRQIEPDEAEPTGPEPADFDLEEGGVDAGVEEPAKEDHVTVDDGGDDPTGTPAETEGEEDSGEVDQDDEEFECETCGETFDTRQALYGHQRAHSGEDNA